MSQYGISLIDFSPDDAFSTSVLKHGLIACNMFDSSEKILARLKIFTTSAGNFSAAKRFLFFDETRQCDKNVRGKNLPNI